MTVDGEEGSACHRWGTSVAVPAGYHLSCDSRQRFRAGGRVTFATLVRNTDNDTLSGDQGNISRHSLASKPPSDLQGMRGMCWSYVMLSPEGGGLQL